MDSQLAPRAEAPAPHQIMPDPANQVYTADEAHWSALMGSAQAGDEAAYRLLLGELSAVIARYLRSRIGDHEFIDDCVQESLIAVHRARHTYDPARRFRPWLFAIVRHKAIDMLRRQRARFESLDDAQREPEAMAEPMADVASGQLMSCLAPEDRQAITLTKIVGLTNAEAAGRLSISESAMKVRVHRAINRLKRLLEADVA